LPPALARLDRLRDAFRAALDENRLIPAATIRDALADLQSAEGEVALDREFLHALDDPADRRAVLADLLALAALVNLARRHWEQEEKPLGRLTALGYALIAGGFISASFVAGPLVGLAFAFTGAAMAFGAEGKAAANLRSAAAAEELARQLDRIHDRLSAAQRAAGDRQGS
jgi:hypothetical protein